MSATAAARRRVLGIETLMDAHVSLAEARDHVERALTLVDRVAGSLDGVKAEQRPLFPVVDVSRKARAS